MLWEVERTQRVDGLDARGRDGFAPRDHEEAADEKLANVPEERHRVNYQDSYVVVVLLLPRDDIAGLCGNQISDDLTHCLISTQ